MSSSILLTLLLTSAAQRSREEAERAFRAAGATSPARARTLAQLSIEGNDSIREFLKSGIVRAVDDQGRLTTSTDAAATSRYFLDEAAIVAEQEAMKAAGSRAWMVLFTIAILVAIGIAAKLLLRRP